MQRDLNLRLPEGSTVLTGDNGAGKSTLALTVAGLLRPLGGQVDASGVVEAESGRSRGGIRIPTRGGQAAGAADRIRISITGAPICRSDGTRGTPSGPATVGMDAEEAEQRADELLAQLRLTRLAKANPYTLSGGEKRRLSVAAMLATRPRLLILDEPTFGQDRATFHTLVRLLQELVAQDYSLLSISHDHDFCRLMGTHEWRLHA